MFLDVILSVEDVVDEAEGLGLLLEVMEGGDERVEVGLYLLLIAGLEGLSANEKEIVEVGAFAEIGVL